ncbi:MAG: hypothetical protein K2K73_02605, partial [Ureaplasma sp.]|nr:hypothetical protein [Ureaplasma sp.]
MYKRQAIVISILSILGISAISGTIAYFVLKNKDSNLNNNESNEIKTIAEDFKTQINNTNIKLKEINEDEIIKQIKSKINLDEKYDFQIDAINVLNNKTIILNIKLFLKSNSNISHTIKNIQLNFEIITSNTDPNLNLIKQIAEDFKNQLNNITIELDNLNVNNIKQKITENINLNQDYDFDILSSSQIQNSQIILDIKLFLISDPNINLILKDVHIKINYSILTQLNEYLNQIKDYLNTSIIELEDYQWINLTNESLKLILNDYLAMQTPSDYDFEIISFIKPNINNSLANLEIKFKLFYKQDINLFVETNLNVKCT